MHTNGKSQTISSAKRAAFIQFASIGPLLEPVSLERWLAAIFAADVAAYSRLIGADEDATLGRQQARRRELIDPKIDVPAAPSSGLGRTGAARRSSISSKAPIVAKPRTMKPSIKASTYA